MLQNERSHFHSSKSLATVLKRMDKRRKRITRMVADREKSCSAKKRGKLDMMLSVKGLSFTGSHLMRGIARTTPSKILVRIFDAPVFRIPPNHGGSVGPGPSS